jgi:hypothetical protein
MLLSIGDQVRPGTYRLHSRFSRAINFDRAGRLVSVVDETIGPGPLNIVIRDLKPALAQARAEPALSILKGLHPSAQGWIVGPHRGDPTLGERSKKLPNPKRVESGRLPSSNALLQITPRKVLFGDRRYRVTSRHRYDSTLELRGMDQQHLAENLLVLREALRKDAPPKSLAFLLDRKRRKNFRTGFEQTFTEQIQHGVQEIFAGKLLTGIRRLKGCGPGLTPAGDDFVAGYLIALRVVEKLRGQNLEPTRNAIFRAARGNNLFSNTFLDLARRGLLFGRMKDLLRALVSSSCQNAVCRAAQALFTVGETSGADLATGLFMILRGSVRHNGKNRLLLAATPAPG